MNHHILCVILLFISFGTQLHCSFESLHPENPARFSEITNFEISSSFLQLYGLEELTLSSIDYMQKFRFVCLGFGVTSFGYNKYRENTFAVSFTTRSEDIDLGLNLKILRLEIPEHIKDTGFGFDIGVLFEPADRLKLGFVTYNINRPKIGFDYLSRAIFSYTSFCVNEDLTLNLEIYKEIQFPLEVKLYETMGINRILTQSLGIRLSPSTFYFGLGFRQGSLIFCYDGEFHSVLGVTHIFSLVYKK